MDWEPVHVDRSLLTVLSPRTRLLGVVAFSVVVAVLQTMGVLLLSFTFSLLLVFLSRISAGSLLLRMFILNLFLLFLWLFVPWGIPGEEVLTLGPASVTREGVSYMMVLTLRSNTIMLALIAFMTSTGVIAMTHAMTGLKIPDKITCLFFLTYRYIEDIHGEYTRLARAMKVRCFRPASNLHTYRSYAYLVGMLLVNGFDRAQRVRSAMLCRGFNGRFPQIEEDRFAWRDALSLLVLGLFLAGVVYADG